MLGARRCRALLGPDRTLLFRPTGGAGSRLVDLTGDLLGWHAVNEPHRAAPGDRAALAAVTVRTPLTTLLLSVCRRGGLECTDVTVGGDRGAAGVRPHWRHHASGSTERQREQ